MSSTKAALKAAKAALDANKNLDAIEHAKTVLKTDSKNYYANVFLGRALEKLDQNEESEKAYEAAIGIKDQDSLAWQGLVGLYEKQSGKKLDSYHDAAVRLAEIHMNEDDKIRCQTVLDKYTGTAKRYGSRAQYKHSLEVLLPTATLYDYLEGRIPEPVFTYSKIADIVEAEEKEKINTEIGQRRTRLGAKISQVTSDVKREVLENSPLEYLYGSIIDWTHDDAIRRQYEEKVLQHAYDTLMVIPTVRKADKRRQVQKMAQGLVILKHQFLLAWKIEMEWKDVVDNEEMDPELLRNFIILFPDLGLSKLLRGFLDSDISPFPKPTDSAQEQNEESDNNSVLSGEDRLILMTEGLEESPSSILAHRIMGLMYLHLEEYEITATTARQGLQCISNESDISGLTLEKLFDAMRIILATALVHFQAPRHHPEARELFENVLHRRPSEISALIGIGLILEEQEEYVKAVDFFDRALKRNSDPKIKAEAAWCKALNGDSAASLQELEACLLDMQGSDTRSKMLRSQTLYRVGMCIWNREPSTKARKSRDGAYARFIASLQADLNYAPAYTILGIYYADYGRDKKRARKCFRKAFELSSSEVDAAERLAQSFAESGEWDLVEVVAQRVVESGKVRAAPGSRKKGVSWPFAALGVVQLNNQEYSKSSVSFQSALRSSPENHHYWIGLGESYHNSGRYIAATKAFENAQTFETSKENSSEDIWFSKYMLANVKRELGEYDDAIAAYQDVLELRPAEFGVSIALLQSLVEGAWHSIELGFFGRAADAASKAINVAKSIAKEHCEAFNLWKAVGDACSMFAFASAYASRLPIQDLLSLLEADVDLQVYNVLAEIDGIGDQTLRTLAKANQRTPSFPQLSMIVAVLAQKRAIHACANDIHARAVAWYNLGWTEHRAHVCSQDLIDNESKQKPMKYLKASVQAFKRAIELEARNAEFWNSLGIVTTELNPKVSQHSFVRSLYLNDKNARVWTNLGTLYLIQNDLQLASDAYTRAQSSDPDYAQAWLGQGMLATRIGDPNEARKLFAHSFEIADSSSLMIKRQFAISSFDHLLSSPLNSSTTSAIGPLFALHQLRSQVPADFASQHLSSLFAERIGDFGGAATTLHLIASNLEAEYETSESPALLMRFAMAKAVLGRVQLADQEFKAAAENAETALNLSEEEDMKNEARQKIRLSAHMTAGLAYYYQGTMDEAISMFRSALEETQGDPDIVCLLAQVLWAKGGDEERGVAREQLFDCVENHPGHSGAVILLGVIAVLDDDRDTIEAVTADLEELRTRDSLTVREQSKVAELLMTISAFFPGEAGQDASEMSQATVTTMLAPSQPHGWSQLANISEEAYPAEAALLTANKACPPGGDLDANDLSKAYSGTGRLDDAQRAVMIAPWTVQGWEALARG